MWFQKVRDFFNSCRNFLINGIENLRLKWSNLESNNIGQIMDYFEIGMFDECYSRLGIVLSIWPKNNHAKYLKGLLCILDGNHNKAKKYLRQVEGLKKDYAQKLLSIIDNDKFESIVSSYIEYHDLDSIENEIRNIEL
ncbi:MAG: hypothetical protein LBB13_03635 [Rickettsiales bacterium]|jgi:hypothetical protein|nr:hypothetical protein [Rickettsiales bacterium]